MRAEWSSCGAGVARHGARKRGSVARHGSALCARAWKHVMRARMEARCARAWWFARLDEGERRAQCGSALCAHAWKHVVCVHGGLRAWTRVSRVHTLHAQRWRPRAACARDE